LRAKVLGKRNQVGPRTTAIGNPEWQQWVVGLFVTLRS